VHATRAFEAFVSAATERAYQEAKEDANEEFYQVVSHRACGGDCCFRDVPGKV
jgi:hypothetical protein